MTALLQLKTDQRMSPGEAEACTEFGYERILQLPGKPQPDVSAGGQEF